VTHDRWATHTDLYHDVLLSADQPGVSLLSNNYLTGVRSPFYAQSCVEKPLFQISYTQGASTGIVISDPEGDFLYPPVSLAIDSNCPWALAPDTSRFSFALYVDVLHPAYPGSGVLAVWHPDNCSLVFTWNVNNVNVTGALLRSYLLATRVTFCDPVNEYGAKVTGGNAFMTLLLTIDDVPVPRTRKMIGLGNNTISVGTLSYPALAFAGGASAYLPSIAGHSDGVKKAVVTESVGSLSGIYSSLNLLSSISSIADEQMSSATVWIENCAFGDTLYIPVASQTAFINQTLYGSSRSSITYNAPGYPSCSIRIAGFASASIYTALLKQVRLNVSSDNPSAADRKITFGLSNNNDLGPNYDAIPYIYVPVKAINGEWRYLAS
jgi:hypothetical protein